MKGILGRKVGMTQLYDDSGEVTPVTVIEAGPCYVTQIKAEDTDGYSAIQVGFEEVPERKLTKGQLGHLQKASMPALRSLRELRLPGDAEQSLGDVIRADIFAEGELVDVTATSKGKGFAGTVNGTGSPVGQRRMGSRIGIGRLARGAQARRRATHSLAQKGLDRWAISA